MFKTNEKVKRLSDLLDGDFAEGYRQFDEIVNFASQAAEMSGMGKQEQALLYLYRLQTVALIEGMNRSEELFELPPAEIAVIAWRASGMAVASLNGQAFSAAGEGAVRKATREQFLEGYKSTWKMLVDEAESK